MSGKGRLLGDEQWPALFLCESASRRERRGDLPTSGEQCEPLRHASASSFTQGKHGHPARVPKEMDNRTPPSCRCSVSQEPTGFDGAQPHLAPFFAQAECGEIATVGRIWQAYAQCIGHKVDDSTIYRLLHRHGWHKVMPRPRHPKSDLETQEQFKKTFQRWWKRQLPAPGGGR